MLGFLKKMLGGKRKQRNHHEDHLETPEQSKRQCDVCGHPTTSEPGHALTTPEVLLNSNYWRIFFDRNKDLAEDHFSIAMTLAQFALQDTAWLVCGRCASLFDSDHGSAGSPARNGGRKPENRRLYKEEASKAFVLALNEAKLSEPPSFMDGSGDSQLIIGTPHKT